MTHHGTLLQKVMVLWAQGMNTADMAKKLAVSECVVAYALTVGRELMRTERLKRVERLADELGANI